MSDSLTTKLIRSLVDQGDGLRLSPYFKLTDQCSVCLGDVCEDPPKGEEYYLVHLVPDKLHKYCKLYDCDHTAEALDTLLQELKTEWA
mgnify:FL=1|jgi:hypothetical protein